MKSVVLACFCAGTFAAVGCAGGVGLPTSPTATATAAASEVKAIDGTVLLTKTCIGDHCTVATSSSGPFPVGSDIHYFGPLLDARTTSRIIVTTPAGDTAEGNCSLSYKKWEGTCVITDGTGALKGLHANVKVTSDFESDPLGIFTWEGRYHYQP